MKREPGVAVPDTFCDLSTDEQSKALQQEVAVLNVRLQTREREIKDRDTHIDELKARLRSDKTITLHKALSTDETEGQMRVLLDKWINAKDYDSLEDKKKYAEVERSIREELDQKEGAIKELEKQLQEKMQEMKNIKDTMTTKDSFQKLREKSTSVINNKKEEINKLTGELKGEKEKLKKEHERVQQLNKDCDKNREHIVRLTSLHHDTLSRVELINSRKIENYQGHLIRSEFKARMEELEKKQEELYNDNVTLKKEKLEAVLG